MKPPTFTVHLPLLREPPDEEGQGWNRPDIWNGEPASADSIVVPNGRPIYALIVSGYNSNSFLDEMMLYNFAAFLMAKGAYVHYAWWNNLLAPYMERPLHSNQSYPGSAGDLDQFTTLERANGKGFPGEDYQLVADAKLFLKAIRDNNPNAIIILAGHSMGGGAVVHIASQTDVLINMLAPIDPVANRNFPFAGVARNNEKDGNWTRWRVTRDKFLGYKKTYNAGTVSAPICLPTGNWLHEVPFPWSSDLLCVGDLHVDNASTLQFQSNIVNLIHRYQMEAKFPYDYDKEYHFLHNKPTGGITDQSFVRTTQAFCGLSRCSDPGGWPLLGTATSECCPGTSDGVGWPADGHGEILGKRGPITNIVPLGVRLRTSFYCGSNCPDRDWPVRSFANSWSNGDGSERRTRLKSFEQNPSSNWSHRPYNPELCLISGDLIQFFNLINKPPMANAGNDRLAECNGPNGATIELNGSASSDPENDALEYTWSGSFGTRQGQIASVTLPIGTHCVTLMVEDPSGHVDKHRVSITVQDRIGPVMNVSLSQSLMWPPNHKMVDIQANVLAFDQCGTVESIVLHSIVASEDANVIGSGNTSPDIADAAFNTHDLIFKLRAERSGKSGRRVYTITYKATDNAGNTTFSSAEVIVENPSIATLRSVKSLLNDEPLKPLPVHMARYSSPFNSVSSVQRRGRNLVVNK